MTGALPALLTNIFLFRFPKGNQLTSITIKIFLKFKKNQNVNKVIISGRNDNCEDSQFNINIKTTMGIFFELIFHQKKKSSGVSFFRSGKQKNIMLKGLYNDSIMFKHKKFSFNDENQVFLFFFFSYVDSLKRSFQPV